MMCAIFIPRTFNYYIAYIFKTCPPSNFFCVIKYFKLGLFSHLFLITCINSFRKKVGRITMGGDFKKTYLSNIRLNSFMI